MTIVRCPTLLALATGAIWAVSLVAYEAPLSPRQVTDAITVANGSPAARTTFHASYRLEVGRPPVDSIAIVTPFRRVVIEAELRRTMGGRTLTQREGLAIAAEANAVLEAYVELTFHPLNTFVRVPEYDVLLEAKTATNALVRPRDVGRVPRFGPRLQGAPLPVPTGPPVVQGSEPLTGGTLVAVFNREALDRNGTYDVVVRDGADTLARRVVNLATLR
jgi:hypothetical protein